MASIAITLILGGLIIWRMVRVTFKEVDDNYIRQVYANSRQKKPNRAR